jgi:hypothetical protein
LDVFSLINPLLTQKFASAIGIQRKDAVITLLSFLVTDGDNKEVAYEVVHAGLPPIAIPVSYHSQYFSVVTIHPNDGSVRINKSGLQLPPLREGKYLCVVQLEMDGRLQHCSRFFNVSTFAPFAYWVGNTIRAGPEIPKFQTQSST